MTQDLLFVCGSLVEGMVHYNKVSSFVVENRKATATGSVYRLEVGFPVYNHEGQDNIEGQLLTLSSADVLMKLLDEYHGYNAKDPSKSLFFKTEIDVTLEGQNIRAITYSINLSKLPSTAVLVKDGNWLDDYNRQPPLTLTLSDRQKLYVKKLGASSGRDIVPINLDLYRELMGKALIVDKGRRLALSKLGQEVFRYLE